MRKCPRCKIVFYLEERTHCLYCETILLTVDKDDTPPINNTQGVGGIKVEQTVLSKVLRDSQIEAYGRMQYMMGSYFRSRTLHFMYQFSRSHFRMSRGFPRFLVQPLNATSFLTLPWVFYNILDSIYFRLAYSSGYCLKCGWKYKQVSRKQLHDPVECEYCQEYTNIFKEVSSGNIAKTEREFKRVAAIKLASGKRSAYNDLCTSKSPLSAFVDVMGIWFTICIYIILIVVLVMPRLFVLMHKLEI